MKNGTHIKALSLVALASVAGILAAFVFQIITARALGPSDFSLFAAFLAIINIGAIGSSALQNSVTVQTALTLHSDLMEKGTKRRFDSSLVESLALGLGALFVLAIFSTPIGLALDASPAIVGLAAISFPLTFVLARNLGVLQGHELAQQTVWWSTAAGVIRVLFGIAALVLASGFSGLVAAVIISLFVTLLLVGRYIRRLDGRPAHMPFDKATIAVLVSSITFAWLTNVDVVFVRALSNHVDAGLYAVSATLVKTGFIVPGTLSLYFLPKFVKEGSDTGKLNFPIFVTTLGMLVLTAFLVLLGPFVIKLLFGPHYDVDSFFLLALCLSSAPWVFIQTLLIRANSQASIRAAIFLVLSAAIQWPVFILTLPNIELMLMANGILGVTLLAALILILHKRKDQNALTTALP